MPEENLLLTIAEVSIGFAGFAGIVALFGRRSAGPWSASDQTRFNALIRGALVSLFGAFLHLAIHSVSPSDSSPWGPASTVFGFVFLVLFWRGWGLVAEISASEDSDANVRGGWVLIYLIGLVALILLVNGLGVFSQAAAGPYLVALFLALAMTGLMFARLLRFA